MSILLLAFITSTFAVSIDFRDVSQQFDESLERMVEDLKSLGEEMALIGTFPGEDNLIEDARMGDFTTIRRESSASLMEMLGRLSVQGTISLEDMVFKGDGNQKKIIVKENLWNYNFWINPESKNCNDGVNVLLTDMGEMKLISDNQLSEDVTFWAKHNMDNVTRQRIAGAITAVFKNHFDFCNLIKEEN